MISFEYLIACLIIVGVLCSVVSIALDYWLDYGHILGKVRWKAAFRAASRIEDNDLLKELKQTLVKEPEFVKRIEKMDAIYWKIAAKNRKFLPWVCVYCISGRLSIPATVFVSSVFYLREGNTWYWVWALPGFVICAAVANVVIQYWNR